MGAAHINHIANSPDDHQNRYHLGYRNVGIPQLQLVSADAFDPESSDAVQHQIECEELAVELLALPIPEKE